MISIKNFVETDIEVLPAPIRFGGFRTTIYIVNGTFSGSETFQILEKASDLTGFTSTTSDAITESINLYFNNGGERLCVAVAPSEFDLTKFKELMSEIVEQVDDYFFVVLSTSIQYSSSGMVSILNFCSDNGWTSDDKATFNTMRACVTTESTSFVTDNSLTDLTVMVKYSTYRGSTNSLVDCAILVGAYYSAVDVTNLDPIEDYNFVQEIIGENEYEDLTQQEFELLTKTAATGYYNVVCNVANKILNIGGDYCKSQKTSIALDFGAACIERDIDYAMIELLTGKLKLNQEGQSKLLSKIREQLLRYVTNGFLETDATYSGDTVKVSYNGTRYTVVEKGDTLPLGYKLFYVPINAISADDKSKNKFPLIYLALQTVHGARLIKVEGSIL